MTAENFKQQYFSLHPKLYRIAYIMVKNTNEAEDIVQETYCKLWDNREKLVDVKQPEAYCIKLVKNLCLDFLRSSRTTQSDSFDDYDFSIPDAGNVAKDIENRETLSTIKRLIEQLPNKQRQALHLSAFAGCSPEEIETIMCESAANVRVLLSRARSALRKKINY